jgi:hypothetical protein
MLMSLTFSRTRWIWQEEILKIYCEILIKRPAHTLFGIFKSLYGKKIYFGKMNLVSFLIFVVLIEITYEVADNWFLNLVWLV